MTNDRVRSRKYLFERARNTKFALVWSLVNVVVWTVFWVTGGPLMQGLLALLWAGLAIYCAVMVRRWQRDLRRDYPELK